MLKKNYLSRKEAAKYLGKHPLTLDTWRCRNVGPPYFKVGKSISYKREDLDAFIENCRVDPAVQQDPVMAAKTS